VSDVSCSFGVIDTNINATHISWLSILTSVWKILRPFVDLVFSKGYILDPKMIGTLPGSTPTYQKRKRKSECQHS
jgi:hypothetical protein